MSNNHVKTGQVSFHTEGRLLQELGERLVGKADVALMELIKNAYDADASKCRLISNNEKLEIVDDGHGMTEQQFIDKWMRIATDTKQRERISPVYERNVTGSKGIGRFAVRFLGKCLEVESVAATLPNNKRKKKLNVIFDWEQIDNSVQLEEFMIKYEIRDVGDEAETGTRLIISKLRNPGHVSLSKDLCTELISIVDPFAGLDTGGFTRNGKAKTDPGFRVIFPVSEDSNQEQDITSTIINNALLHLNIRLLGNFVDYTIKHKDGRTLLKKRIKYENNIGKGLFADIRYCPRRAGIFRGTNVDGRVISGWLKEKGGVGIVDHGFRIYPYGFPDNDWLNLGFDNGHNRREWRAELMKQHYPMNELASSDPKQNPMLYLPNFHQLIGAVFVQSSQDSGNDLIPSMDREGFIVNPAFQQLNELVRAGIEMIAYADHQEQRRIEAEAAQIASKELREDFKVAVDYVKKISSLTEGDKSQVVQRFHMLAKELDNVDDYHRAVSTKLDMIGLLGILSGFMTHEMKRLVQDLDSVIESMKYISVDPIVFKRIRDTRDELYGQMQFASTFIHNVQNPMSESMPLNVRAQVSRVIDRFNTFITSRNVNIVINVDKSLITPPLPVTLYCGILLNLFTNALKAIFGGQGASDQPSISINSWNDTRNHTIEVADTGIGIPENIRKRIWDPLFTTTSGGSSNPLGSGMGLGLTLVKRILTEVKGRIDTVDPPPGFSTCFRVQFPFERK